MGSWVLNTPKKPVYGGSSMINDERVIYQDLNGVPSGGYEERAFFNNGVVQDLNYAVQGIDYNGVYDNGAHQGITNRDRMVNRVAGEELLGRNNAASPLATSVIRNTAGNGNIISDAGMVTQSGSSQAGQTDFQLDDLLDPNLMPFSFTSLLTSGDNLFQDPQYGTPAFSRPIYNLNSPPRGEDCGSSFQSVPSTPSLCRTGEEKGILEKITTTVGHETTQPKSDKSIVDSSVVNSTEVTEQMDGNRQNDLGFDLNKTPQQKTTKRRKKFMPKVIVEGKPKRKPRKPTTQENVKSEDSGRKKRKKDQYTNAKESVNTKLANVGDTSNRSPKITPRSCRKALNFDVEKTGDERQGDSESEIVQNASDTNTFSETREATGGTNGSCMDAVTQIDQTHGLVAADQPLEASIENHTQMPARDQQRELLIGNQQFQFPAVTQNTQPPMGNQQAWLQMKNQSLGYLLANQQPQMTVRNQQPRVAMGNQQPMYLIGSTPRPALVSGNQQPGGFQGNKRLNQQTQQTCVPARYGQYGSPIGMQQLIMSNGGQQHGLLMKNQQPGFLLRTQQPELLMRNYQPGSSIRGQQPRAPLMNQQPGTPKGFTHLNPMAAAFMSSSLGLRSHSQSQTPATNLQVEHASRSLNGIAGTCQRSSIPGSGSLQRNIHQGSGYIPSQERSNGESFDLCKNASSQNSSLPTSTMTKLVEARGSKRQYNHEMGQMQNHDLNPVGRWPLLQQIVQLQNKERQNSKMRAEYLDAAKKMKIQKVVQENRHGVPHEVIVIEDDPTDGERQDQNTGSFNDTASKGIPSRAKTSAYNEKCSVPKTPARKGFTGRKKSGAPPAHASEIEVSTHAPEPTIAKTPSSKSKAKEKGRKSIQDSGKPRGPSGDLLCQDYIAEIIYRLQNLYLGEKSREQEQNALVLYKGDGAVVPYEAKKRKPRPKVDLDDETTRIWNLLMGKGDQEGDEGMDRKKEKWWEEERRVFRGRAESFIARMHLVQGDRRFSPWKGSVVDSVIGVFLTQNVTDHLSSSAFMSLASRFPPKLSSNHEDARNTRNVVVEDPEGCIFNLNEIPSWQEKVQNPSDTQVSGVDNGTTEQQRDWSNSGIERFNFLDNNIQNLEVDVLSSQDSFDPAIFHPCGNVGSCSSSKSEADFFTTKCETKAVSGSTHSVHTGSPNLSDEVCLQRNERPLLSEESGDAQIRETAKITQKKPSQPSNDTSWQKEGLINPSSINGQSMIQQPQLLDIEDFGMEGEGFGYSRLSLSPRVDRRKNKNVPRRVFRRGVNVGREFTDQIIPSKPQEVPETGLCASSSTNHVHQGDVQQCGTQQNETNEASQLQRTFMDLLNSSDEFLTRQSSTTQNIIDGLLPRDRIAEEVLDAGSKNTLVESNSSNNEHTAVEYKETNPTIVREMKGTLADGKKPTSQWDSLRKDVEGNEGRKERSKDSMDSIDYEAIRRASVSEISEAIKERGMNNMLAVRIKDFLDRIVKDHGAIDLEWLRDVPADKAKDYLLSIRGLGLKSVECVRLLTLHNLAFPVDTNVGRIAVRLGWVPLQPLPESLQLHLLELYPVLESIQKYLWPRLCKLDQPMLYELHYQLITFGKVFCTKSRPNCNACPMRGECRHFASAYASARLALPAPGEKSLATTTMPVPPKSFSPASIPMMELPPPPMGKEVSSNGRNYEPIIEEPSTPEQECIEITESDIEYDYYNEDPDEIPTIKLNIEEFGVNLKDYVERNMEIQEGDMSRALVALDPATTTIPTPKLKNISRLRTEHQVYELPDSHPLLYDMDKREPDDPSPYLLAIWTPGETADSTKPPEQKCLGQISGKMCLDETCAECNRVREAKSQTVRGTLLVPCRTAMRGSFPLNGTYFQVNELFADHASSLKPIDVPRDWIWNLRRRTVYFGTSVTSIFRGLTTEEIQFCFWKGYVCVRGFEQKTRAPRPLMARLHFPASKLKNNNNKT